MPLAILQVVQCTDIVSLIILFLFFGIIVSSVMAPTTRMNEEGKIEYQCYCHIWCKQPTWLPKSTYYSHQKLLDGERAGQTAAAARKRASGHSSELELSVNDIQASAKHARTSLGSQNDPEMDEDDVDGGIIGRAFGFCEASRVLTSLALLV